MTRKRKMPKKGKSLKVIHEPDPRLRQKSELVAEVNDEIRSFIDDMVRTMHDENGVGLAAVQVGVLKRIVVIDHDWIIKERDKSDMPLLGTFLFMINPKIVRISGDKAKRDEGCLSFPGVYCEIERPAEVEVEYLDYNGKEQKIIAEGLLSACIQHEIDHTNGVVFLDYLSPLKRKMMVKKLEKYKKANNL